MDPTGGLDALDLQPGTAVLHVARPGGCGGDVCERLVAAASGTELYDLLRIEFVRDGEGSVDDCRGQTQRGPGPSAVVVVGAAGPEQACDGDRRVTTIARREDLPGVGIAVAEHLAELGGGQKALAVCLDGLEGAFECVSFDVGFGFCHVLVAKLAAAGAVSHFHLDPTGVSVRSMGRLAGLFDVVVREDETGVEVCQP